MAGLADISVDFAPGVESPLLFDGERRRWRRVTRLAWPRDAREHGTHSRRQWITWGQPCQTNRFAIQLQPGAAATTATCAGVRGRSFWSLVGIGTAGACTSARTGWTRRRDSGLGASHSWRGRPGHRRREQRDLRPTQQRGPLPVGAAAVGDPREQVLDSRFLRAPHDRGGEHGD